ncbi:MAG: hypothetical protein EBR02_09820 [Alphaproteobacteria bacterium]|nr:hypothetical protein [Alphaproteobacteria bacterium]
MNTIPASRIFTTHCNDSLVDIARETLKAAQTLRDGVSNNSNAKLTLHHCLRQIETRGNFCRTRTAEEAHAHEAALSQLKTAAKALVDGTGNPKDNYTSLATALDGVLPEDVRAELCARVHFLDEGLGI